MKNKPHWAAFYKSLLKITRIMRVSLFLILISATLAFSANTYSQNTKLTLNLSNSTVKEVIRAIEDQSEFIFFYQDQHLDLTRKVSVNVSGKQIDEVLNQLFAGTDNVYTIRDRQIVVGKSAPKPAEALAANVRQSQLTEQQPQRREITGTVRDARSLPLPGVTVIVQGTTIGVVTDNNGNFQLLIPVDAQILEFSFVGMKSQQVTVGNNTIFNITMEEETLGIEEVVAIGYGTVSRKNLTTAITKVSTDEIVKSASSNMTQLLMGRAGGLRATVASAQPGGNVNISIRGAGTPVYVVDGVVMPAGSLELGSGGSMTVIPANVNRAGLGGINPEDIESVEILKDASASIYGIGAANGVILITTKKGKEGPVNVTYDGSHSIVNNYKYLEELNAQQYMEMVNIFNKEQYLYTNQMVPYGTKAYDDKWNAPFSTSQIAGAQTTKWKDYVLRDGLIMNHNLTVNGGTRAVDYYFSGNYFRQDGSVSNSSMERYTVRSRVGFKVNDFIRLTSTINLNRNEYNNSTVGGTSQGRGAQAAGALTAALTYPPFLPLKDANDKYSVFLNIPNPVGMESIEDLTSLNGVYMNFAADFNIIQKMLTARLLYGNNLEGSRRTTYIPSDVYFDQMYKSRGNLSYGNRQAQTMEATVAFNKEFGTFMTMDAVAGIGYYYNDGNGMNVSYDGQHDAIRNDDIGSSTGVRTPASYRYSDEKRSQFARAHFDFLDRYVLAVTLRRDGTDKFFPDKKYALFPSVSLAWKITNENFMKDVEIFDLLKLRASYGETGSDNLGTTLYGTYGPYGNQIMFNNNAVKYIPIILNGLDYPDVSWQKTTMENIGIDFSVLKNRFWGSFDVYRNDITDMLGTANTAGLSMFGTYPINGAHMRRQGWDATLNSKNIQTGNFTWVTILTLTRYNSLWIERMPNYDYNTYEKRPPVESSLQYYYETRGIINADMSNMPASQPAAARKPGYPIIVDQNNDGEITIDDIKTRNLVPSIYFGFGNTFTYKNFDLDVFMYSQLGIYKYNYARDWASATELANQNSNSNKFIYDLWNSQTNPNGTMPGIAWNLATVSLPGGAGTDMGYQDASFLRIRNITLGYNLTKNQLGQLGTYLNNIRIFVDAQNPLTFTKFEGFDPEVNTGGGYKGGKAEYPMTRTYSAGVKINF